MDIFFDDTQSTSQFTPQSGNEESETVHVIVYSEEPKYSVF